MIGIHNSPFQGKRGSLVICHPEKTITKNKRYSIFQLTIQQTLQSHAH